MDMLTVKRMYWILSNPRIVFGRRNCFGDEGFAGRWVDDGVVAKTTWWSWISFCVVKKTGFNRGVKVWFTPYNILAEPYFINGVQLLRVSNLHWWQIWTGV